MLELQNLLAGANGDVNTAQALFALYCTLALLADAYESLVLSFQVKCSCNLVGFITFYPSNWVPISRTTRNRLIEEYTLSSS
jgi:hypothetical protein